MIISMEKVNVKHGQSYKVIRPKESSNYPIWIVEKMELF